MKKHKRKYKIEAFAFLAAVVLVIAAVAGTLLANSGTGAVTYSGGDRSCTVSDYGKTYSGCMWVKLSKGETRITGVPWAAKTITGVAGYIRDYVPGANVNAQVNAWIDLTDWLNNKIYDATPAAFKDLGKYAKTDGTTTILVGWTYKVSDSAWGGGWKWVDVYYDYYYETNAKKMVKYSSSTAGFYVDTKNNKISH